MGESKPAGNWSVARGTWQDGLNGEKPGAVRVVERVNFR